MIAALGARIPLEDVAIGARFLWRLPGFLRRPISVEEARATLRGRLAHREADFLALARAAIYGQATSPYRQLLDLAGCEYGDLERLVDREGLEGALQALFRRGVYLTVDELKGRRPAIRGSAAVAADPSRLRNPRAASHLRAQSGGSGGAPTQVYLDFAALRTHAVDKCVALDACGAGWVHALWLIPGGTATGLLLQYAAFRAAPARWFSQLDPAAAGLHPRYRWSARLLRWASLLAGVPLPRPRHVPLEAPLPIARWMAKVRRAGRVPHLTTFPSSALRLCEAATGAGLDLRGAWFEVGGEPVTAARRAAIERAGGEVLPAYASAESGAIGRGCLAPEAADDLHLLRDLHALIQPGPASGAGLPPQALLLTSLRPTARFTLLNVSLGDQAQMVQRSCGCPLERLGWAIHLHTIRSFEKLTAGGMTFLDTDVIRVLEEVLPTRFGGGPTDYQLVEEEAEGGRPRLRLLVHPRVGPLDVAAVADTFLGALGPGSGGERLMVLHWRQADLLRVERAAPEAGASGKILHLRPGRRPPGRPARRERA